MINYLFPFLNYYIFIPFFSIICYGSILFFPYKHFCSKQWILSTLLTIWPLDIFSRFLILLWKDLQELIGSFSFLLTLSLIFFYHFCICLSFLFISSISISTLWVSLHTGLFRLNNLLIFKSEELNSLMHHLNSTHNHSNFQLYKNSCKKI